MFPGPVVTGLEGEPVPWCKQKSGLPPVARQFLEPQILVGQVKAEKIIQLVTNLELGLIP